MPDWTELEELIERTKELAGIIEVIQFAILQHVSSQPMSDAMCVLLRLIDENTGALDAWLNEYKDATSTERRQQHEQLTAC